MGRLFLNPCSKSRLMLWLLLLCVGFIARADAQQLTAPPKDNPSISWQTPATAVQNLLAEIQLLNQQIGGLVPGTPDYVAAARRVAYYKGIVRFLGQGHSVPQSLELAQSDAATLGGEQEVAYTPKTILKTLYEEALGLVTN